MNEETVGNASSIPVPELGAQQPSSDLPPLTGTIEGTARKRKRRGKQEPEPEKPPEPPPPPLTDNQRNAIGAAIGSGMELIFATVATLRGEHWRKSKDECERAGTLWAIGLDSAGWLAGSGKYAPLAIAALATAGMVMPCVQRDQELAREKAGPKPNELPDGRQIEVMQ